VPQPASCIYQDDAFVTRVLKIIADHDPEQPLFLFWAPVRCTYALVAEAGTST